MITHNRPEYTQLSLARLVATCDKSMRVWLWHNGMHAETLEVARKFAKHPAVYRFHHSIENVRLREPTNWLFGEARGDYVAKVDDDCLVPNNWVQPLKAAHEANPSVGVLACWPFQPEDYIAELATQKIISVRGEHKILVNCWVGGSGVVMKRECISKAGLIRRRESFPSYCIRLARTGWLNGWYFPFVYQEHMDDPQAKHTLIKCDSDLHAHMPLSARTFGSQTLADWDAVLRQQARTAQEAPTDPRVYSPWRRFLRRRIYARAAKTFGYEAPRW